MTVVDSSLGILVAISLNQHLKDLKGHYLILLASNNLKTTMGCRRNCSLANVIF